MPDGIDFSKVRVNIEEETHELYQKYTKDAGENLASQPFKDMPDMFVTAVCMGLSANTYREIPSGKRKDILVGFSLKDHHTAVLLSVAYRHTGDMEVISSAKDTMRICEAYANGGVRILSDILVSHEGLEPLYRFSGYVSRELG
jgi:hypothetical protein